MASAWLVKDENVRILPHGSRKDDLHLHSATFDAGALESNPKELKRLRLEPNRQHLCSPLGKVFYLGRALSWLICVWLADSASTPKSASAPALHHDDWLSCHLLPKHQVLLHTGLGELLRHQSCHGSLTSAQAEV